MLNSYSAPTHMYIYVASSTGPCELYICLESAHTVQCLFETIELVDHVFVYCHAKIQTIDVSQMASRAAVYTTLATTTNAYDQLYRAKIMMHSYIQISPYLCSSGQGVG